MTGMEEIDWESAVDFAKRFGGFLIAILFALGARRKKKAAMEAMEEGAPELQADSQEIVTQAQPIEPGVDAAKLASEYSSGPG